jgi:hypothetical protein
MVPSRESQSPACARGDDSRRLTPVELLGLSLWMGQSYMSVGEGQLRSRQLHQRRRPQVAFGVVSVWNAENHCLRGL